MLVADQYLVTDCVLVGIWYIFNHTPEQIA